MKLLHIKWGHPCNVEFIVRACRMFNIEYHYTNESSPPDQSYDIIWAPCEWIDPDRYPTSKIMFGPHFWVFPNPQDPLFTQSKPEHATRCIYLSLSNWNKKVYDEFVPLSKQVIPFVSIPFGLDFKRLPKIEPYEYDCIIYYKSVHPSRLQYCVNMIASLGLRYKIYFYGSYQKGEYVSTLQKTKFAVWIGSHESQGFALEECLASNTPMYIYDAISMKDEYSNGIYTYQHHSEKLLSTSAPYWSEQCGMKVYSDEEFASHLSTFINQLSNYQPLEYVENTLTDNICFQRMVHKLGITLG